MESHLNSTSLDVNVLLSLYTKYYFLVLTGPEVIIKLISCSTELSMKF